MPYGDDEALKQVWFSSEEEDITDIKVFSNPHVVIMDLPRPQLVGFNINWKLPSIEYNPRPPIDIVFVMEKSEKISVNQFSVIREALGLFLDNLEDHDRVSTVLYDDFAYKLHGLLPVNEEKEELIMSSIRNIYLMGGRDTVDGICHGLEILKQRNYKNPLAAIYIISNGIDTQGVNDLQKIVDHYESTIVFNIFGIGKNQTENNFKHLAGITKGNYFKVENVEELVNYFQRSFEYMTSLVAYSADIKIKIKEVKNSQTNFYAIGSPKASLSQESEGNYTISIPFATSGAQYSIHFQTSFPADLEANGVKTDVFRDFVEIQCLVDGVARESAHSLKWSMNLLKQASEPSNEIRPSDLMDRVKQLIIENKMVEARELMNKIKEMLEQTGLKPKENNQ